MHLRIDLPLSNDNFICIFTLERELPCSMTSLFMTDTQVITIKHNRQTLRSSGLMDSLHQ